ncbi:MAG: hypothetical protein V2A65_09265 [Candidatus Omnitrophota bacterium]
MDAKRRVVKTLIAAWFVLSLLFCAKCLCAAPNVNPGWDLKTGTASVFSSGGAEGMEGIKISLPPGTNESGVLTEKPGWPVEPNSEYAVTLRLKSQDVPAAILSVTETNASGDVVRPWHGIRTFHTVPAEWNYFTHGFFTGPDTSFVLFEVRANACGTNKDKQVELFFASLSIVRRGPAPEVGEKGMEQVLDPGLEKSPTGILTQQKTSPGTFWIQHAGYIGKLTIMADGRAHDGKQYLHSETVTASLPSGIIQENKFPLSAGSLVSISFWVRGRGEAYSSISFINNQGGWMYGNGVNKIIDSPDKWENVKSEFKVEDLAVARSQIVFYNFGSLDLDDYSVVVYPPKPLPLPEVE